MPRLLALLIVGAVVVQASGQGRDLKKVPFNVEGVNREALIHFPAGKGPAPVVFVFHGHGGTMHKAADQFACHEHWSEAVCVYMQGLPTKTKSDPMGLEPGWQNQEEKEGKKGKETKKAKSGNRDLDFFDAVLDHLKEKNRADPNRIYATGFSNGGGFTYLLWAARGDVLAAVGPCGAVAAHKIKDLKPKPCIHIAGENDDQVEFENQQKTMEAVREVNGCDTGKPWPKAGKMLTATLYHSKSGAPFVSVIHPGGHEVPKQAGRLITRFFSEHPKN